MVIIVMVININLFVLFMYLTFGLFCVIIIFAYIERLYMFIVVVIFFVYLNIEFV